MHFSLESATLFIYWKIAPALAAGNCVIAKPSEITPLTAYLLSEICREADLPGGVLNIVHGLGTKAGAAIVCSPKYKGNFLLPEGQKQGSLLPALLLQCLKNFL